MQDTAAYLWRTTWRDKLPARSLEQRMTNTVAALDPLRLPHDAPMPHSVLSAQTKNCERSYSKWLKTQASEIWLQELRTELTAPPIRLRAYVTLHLHLPIRRSLFKAAPYLRAHAPNILALLRLRTQSCADWIPTHI